MINYKVAELMTVTDEEMEKTLNEMGGEGWSLEGIHFAMKESSRRPSMAFMIFSRREESKGDE